jgi:hypothetical protein
MPFLPILSIILLITILTAQSQTKTNRNFHKVRQVISGLTLCSSLICTPAYVTAADGGGNILTNPLLENIRRVQQADDDDEQYTAETKSLLLVPIVKMQQELGIIAGTLQQSSSEITGDVVKNMITVLSDSKYDKKEIKRIFNRYSDNIFYSNPDEANLYLAGGTTPSSRQTQQYLLRNDIITHISDLKDDLEQMLTAEVIVQQDVDDTASDCESARNSFELYLKLADPTDIKTARDVMKS